MKTRKILSLIVCAIMMFSIVGCTFLQDVESIEITSAPQIKYVLNADRAAALTAIKVSVKMRGDTQATTYNASNDLLTVENFDLSKVGSRTAVIYVTSSPLFKVYFDYQVVGNAEADFAGGNGAEATPYLITNTQQFYNISKIEDAKTQTFYKLANDIDFTFEGGNIALPMVVNADIDLGTFTIKGLKTHLVSCADTIKIHNGTIILGGDASIVCNGKPVSATDTSSAFTFSKLKVFGDVMTSETWYSVFNCYSAAADKGKADDITEFSFDNISSSVNISSTGVNVGELIGHPEKSKITYTKDTIKLSNVIQAAKDIFLVGNNGEWMTVSVFEKIGETSTEIPTGTNPEKNTEDKLANITSKSTSTRKKAPKIENAEGSTKVDIANISINDSIVFNHTDTTVVKYIFQISVSVHKLVEGSYSGNYPRIIQKTVYVTNTNTSQNIDTGFKKLMVYEAKYKDLGSQFTIPTDSTITEFNSGFGIAKLTDKGVVSEVYYYDGGATHRLLQGAQTLTSDTTIKVTLSVFSYDVLGNLKGAGKFSYDQKYTIPTP
ncbi:MAG: hypothetical protein RR307_00980 [Clostridia bacterium]